MRERFKVFLILFLCILWVGILFSIGTTKDVPLGAVSGKIIRADNGGPVKGAKVYHPVKNFFTKTDKDGFYSLYGVPEGKYNLSVYAKGYELSYFYGVSVFEGKTTQNINFKMYPCAPYFYLYSPSEVFTPLEKPRLACRGYLLKDFALKLYRIESQQYLEIWQDFSKIQNLKIDYIKPVYQKNLSYPPDEEDRFEGVIDLPRLEEGIYLADLTPAKKGLKPQRASFVISRFGLVIKRSPKDIMVYAQDFLSGKPVEKAGIKIYRENQLLTAGQTNSEGIYASRIYGSEYSYKIMAQSGFSFAFIQAYSGGSPTPYKIYLYTERPVYRPGQEVYFKGILRENMGFKYKNLPGQNVEVKIKDSNGNTVFKNNYDTDEFGTFNGSFGLSEELTLGEFSIITTYLDRDFYRGFKVAEYKKPEYKVELKTNKKQYVAGEVINCAMKSQYYFGAPASGAKVRYTVYESAYRGWWVNLDSFRLGEEEKNYGKIIAEGTEVSDEAGQANLKIPTGAAAYDKLIGIEVEVEDASKRTVTSSLSVLVTRGMFDLVLESSKYIYNKDEEIKFSVNTIDYDGREIGNIEVSADVFKVSYEEKEGTYVEKLKRAENFKVATDKKGHAEINFSARENGSYKVVAEAYDERKNKITSDWYVWVTGPGVSPPFAGSLQIITDRKEYKAGEKAKVLINLPSSNCYALLTVEGRDLFLTKLIYSRGNSINYELPIKEEYLPNVSLCVSLIKDKQLVSDEAAIKVSPGNNYINLEVSSSKSKYEPGEEAAYRVKATDINGRPVVCELSFGLVDEAIYAISPETIEDIKDFFYGLQPNYVYTNYSFPQYYGGMLDKEPGIKVRRKFEDTACFKPDIITNTNGEAVFKVKLPDNLTSWRASLRAVSMDTKVGSALHNVIASKDLLVRLEVPRFITQNDSLEIAGVVHNYTQGEEKVKVTLRARGVDVLSSLNEEGIILPQDKKRFFWKVKAVSPGEAVFLVSAKGSKLSDAMELKVPVLPKAIAEIKSLSGIVEAQVEIKVGLPSSVIKQATEFKVYFSPSIAGVLLQGLEYLASYPYGCVEQTMSAFLPDVMVFKAFKELNIKDAKLERELPVMVKKGLLKLYQFQHADGGWGWWKEDETSSYLTAYVMFGLNEAKKSGFDVDSEIFSRGLKCLREFAKAKPEDIRTMGGARKQNSALNSKAYMLYVLSECGYYYNDMVLNLYENNASLNNYTKALLALMLDKIGEKEKSKIIIGILDRNAVGDEASCYWESDSPDYSWTDNNIEATSYVLKALVNLEPSNSKITKALNWLAKIRKGIHWTSTKDTAAVIYALCDYLRKSREFSPDYKAKIYFNEKPIKEIEVKDVLSKESVCQINIPANLIKKENVLKIEKKGAGRLYYSYELKYFPKVEKIKAVSGGIEVSRRYFKLERKKNKNKLEDIPVLLSESGKVEIGERLQVEIKLNCSRDYEYVIIEDPLPAGFEVVIPEEERNWGSLWWNQQEVRDEKIVYFSTFLCKGKHTLTYQIRAEIPGVFGVLPTQVNCMYLPQIGGNSDENKIVVGE